MKKSIFQGMMAIAAMSVAGAGFLTSCGGNKAQKEAQEDSVQVIEEMVAAVTESMETPETTNEYNAAFFNDATKQSEAATDSTYAVTPSGLKYVMVTPGTGKRPAATDNVTVHYTGMLTDGTVFDSSIDRGEPTTFPLNRVIPGWTEGLQLMQEGGTAVFYIPSNLAYGENGIPGTIPPAAPLIFQVQLLSVN